MYQICIVELLKSVLHNNDSVDVTRENIFAQYASDQWSWIKSL